MSIEDLLVRRIVCQNPEDDSGEEIKEILNSDLDWDYFLDEVRAEKLAALIYYNLCRITGVRQIVPVEIWQGLQDCYLSTAARNSLLYQDLSRVLECFTQAGIEAIILKGAHLAQFVYGNPALRPMNDIDILIHRRDLYLAAERLRRLGYNNSASYPEDFRKDAVIVDIHWDLLNLTRVRSRRKCHKIDLAEVWRDSVAVEVKGQGVRVLSPEYCLLNLCLHLTMHHGLQGLLWFVDVARAIGYYKNRLNWPKFTAKALEYKISRPVYYVLFYIQQVFGQEIPEFVSAELRPPRLGYLERKILGSLVSSAPLQPLEAVKFFFSLLSISNLSGRLTFLREIALPAPAALAARYNISGAQYLPRSYLTHFKSALSVLRQLLRRLKRKRKKGHTYFCYTKPQKDIPA